VERNFTRKINICGKVSL